MLNNKENIRIINIDSIILLLIVLLGLLIHNGTFSTSTEHKSNPIRTYASESHNSAIFSPGIRVQIFQKIWILNKDNFNLLAFNRNPLSEDKKTGILISYLQNIRVNSDRITSFIFRYYLFPAEKDELPLLS